ncbi:MAG: sigma-70 family RNA polymerase sigma factor [Nitrospiraceae bacterium]|nr:sigma-70 family RNA polymerase sigma factor [Nitrospiraceae bacterium]MDA8207884.1 sigma-70 family RNA polymerase sigma factor [Actinomycetota bacterium]
MSASAGFTGASDDDEAGERSFSDFFSANYPRLVRTLALAGAEGSEEDLAQEAFAIVMTHWSAANRHGRPDGYLYRCAFRQLAKYARKRKLAWPLRAMPAGEPREDDFEDLICTLDEVAQVVDKLPPKTRACLVAKVAGSMSTKEIAASLGIMPGTVRKHLSDAAASMRIALGREHEA